MVEAIIIVKDSLIEALRVAFAFIEAVLVAFIDAVKVAKSLSLVALYKFFIV